MLCAVSRMAGVGGVEPPHTAPETAVLPLDDTPVREVANSHLKNAKRYDRAITPFGQGVFWKNARKKAG